MTVELSVTAVREALQTRSARDAEGPRSSLFLGRLFHEVVAALLGPGDDAGVPALLSGGSLEPGPIAQRAYRAVVGPRLARDQAALQGSATDLLTFWAAVEAAVRWLCELVSTGRAAGLTDAQLGALLRPELPVDRLLEHPSWREPVRLSGQLDLLVQVPAGAFCVAELKTGRGSAEADLAQACLYHLILGGRGSLAVVRFSPERSEVLLDERAVAPARDALLALVGALAGVVSPPSVEPGPTPAPDSRGDTQALGRRLADGFREYGVEIRLGEPILGPTFVRFPARLGPRQQVTRLQQNAANVQVRLGLAAPPLVIVERGQLMVDVQRPDRQIVEFAAVERQLRDAPEPRGGALVPLGVDLAGNLRFANLGDPLNCHLLVAGTTGSGKSEWLRFALAGLALRYSPAQVQFLLIDPKRNAFLELRGSPYVYGPRGIIFPGDHEVTEVLEELVAEMEARYRAFAEVAADDLTQYVARTHQNMPRIVVACDEYFDLIHRSKAERAAIEILIARLGSKARAAGIHLLLATQQPSREVIGGILDTNITARVGLQTQKPIESKMLLGQAGAESLLGHGDLLFRDVGTPVRLQAPLTRAEDRARLFGRRA